MPRFITFTTYDSEDPQALTEDEFAPLTLDETDWSEYVWQFADDKAQAIAQHDAKMDAYFEDCEAGRPMKETY